MARSHFTLTTSVSTRVTKFTYGSFIHIAYDPNNPDHQWSQNVFTSVYIPVEVMKKSSNAVEMYYNDCRHGLISYHLSQHEMRKIVEVTLTQPYQQIVQQVYKQKILESFVQTTHGM